VKGAAQVIPESGAFDAAEVLSLLRAHDHVSFFAAPTIVKRLVDEARGPFECNLQTIVYGGGPMYLADLRDAMGVFGNRLAQIYGQGESPMTITFLSRQEIAAREHPRWAERLASAGRPYACIEVKVADDEDRALPAGTPGEILCKGDVVMAGYWKNRQATETTLKGGWLHTGDVGVLDEEGYLTLKDRSKDMIISGGSNIYPREIEEVLLAHDKVREVSVIGRPDPEWGEVVVAYVVGEVGAKELDALCLARIARFKRPKDYVFVDALPKNNYGKILKTELRARDARREKKHA
jgi:long-chain acyl-CoA synthetase